MFVCFFQRHKLVIAISIVLTVNAINAQSFSKLEKAERIWVIKHPFAAIKAKSISKFTLLKVDSLRKAMVLDTFLSGGQLDAFRHIFWMYQLTNKIGQRRARTLGKAHELANYQQYLNQRLEDAARPDSLSSVMDFRNNELGIQLAIQHSTLNESIGGYIIKFVKEGKATILKRQNGVLVRCDLQVIVHEQFRNKWYVPYCLVMSNE